MDTPARDWENGFYHLFQQKTHVNNIEPKDKNSLYSSFSHSANIKHLLCAKHYSRWEELRQNWQNPCLSGIYILGDGDGQETGIKYGR